MQHRNLCSTPLRRSNGFVAIEIPIYTFFPTQPQSNTYATIFENQLKNSLRVAKRTRTLIKVGSLLAINFHYQAHQDKLLRFKVLAYIRVLE